jgi:flagellar basal body-associated protein FliL
MTKRILYILIGAIVLVLLAIGVCIYALLPTITSAMAANQTPTPTPTVSATPTQRTNTTAKLLKQSAPDIKNQISQGLHLTSDQLTAQLKSGKTLNDVATTQNISSTQLQTIVGNAIQSALKPAVANGTLTQKQVDKLAKKYQSNPTLLDHLLTMK